MKTDFDGEKERLRQNNKENQGIKADRQTYTNTRREKDTQPHGRGSNGEESERGNRIIILGE